MLIGINGKTGSGRNTIARIIQYLEVDSIMKEYKNWTGKYSGIHGVHNFINDVKGCTAVSNVKVKKYSDKIKQIGCIILGCNMSDWEDDKFLDKELGEEWNQTIYNIGTKEGGTIISHLNDEELADMDLSHYTEYYNNGNVSMSIEDVILTPRKLLNRLDYGCKVNLIHPDIWVNALISDYKPLPKTKKFEVSERKFINVNDYYGTCITCEKKVLSSNKRFVKCDDCVDKEEDKYPKWVITDVNTKNEAQAIKDRGGILIRVNMGSYHLSETGLDYNNDFNYIIDNNGTIEELVEKIKLILEQENLL